MGLWVRVRVCEIVCEISILDYLGTLTTWTGFGAESLRLRRELAIHALQNAYIPVGLCLESLD